MSGGRALISAAGALNLDRDASVSWGLEPQALVETAGRLCARALKDYLRNGDPGKAGFVRGPVLALAGPGNNGADALVMLRALLMDRDFSAPAAVLSRPPAENESTPRSSALRALKAMGVPVYCWREDREKIEFLVQNAGIILDGIAGTGIRGALEGVSAEMVRAVNERTLKSRADPPGDVPLVAAVDVPSGCSDSWKNGDTVLGARVTLAVEPVKKSLYVPALRGYCGIIIPVEGIFPAALLGAHAEKTELLSWSGASRRIPPIAPWAYKYERGVAEIHAGAVGSSGAARIAAAGALSGGAGLVRLFTAPEIYPQAAVNSGGIMVLPETAGGDGRFPADALLLGPGWGRGETQRAVLRNALEAERGGVPLILDADAIALTEETVFSGNAVLTPHAGEMAAYTGIPKERLLAEPELIRQTAVEKNAVLLFKSHVLIAASPDGRMIYIDGMEPALGAGGSGDLLAGLCAALCARLHALKTRGLAEYDGLRAAAAAGALLIAASRKRGRVFADPLELAAAAGELAGEAWLPAEAGFPQEFLPSLEAGRPGEPGLHAGYIYGRT
ncbi:MAG: bifunctional ADP-dependent NAD(P)H-hydrate dehydratase/NAD(P)H-hydrate epimerase [Treponema sp.]|nr:bifunctional ADP-dependent NAD(P)H-hydrate dehydratase/NAD(P)H-hydrate epimerase [Treponema sp.]